MHHILDGISSAYLKIWTGALKAQPISDAAPFFFGYAQGLLILWRRFSISGPDCTCCPLYTQPFQALQSAAAISGLIQARYG